MIAHEVVRTAGKAGRFSALATYVLTDGQTAYRHLAHYLEADQGDAGRVQYSRVTNCGCDDPQWAIMEIEAVQGMNTRARNDKTYHLVVSFREDEDPSREVLDAIEDAVCEHLGFGEHQRISALHRDTDNVHLHLAINKIHPKRLTMHEPYYSHRALSDICQVLEHRHGLEQDNHIGVVVRDSGRFPTGPAGNLEAHRGQVSLQRWVQEQAVPVLRQCDSWQALHAALAESHLALTPRGNGLVFKDRGSDTAVKASSVGRAWSKGALEQQFGAYEPPLAEAERINPTRRYAAAPRAATDRVEAKALYRAFEAQRRARNAQRQAALAAIRVSLASQRKTVQREFMARREAVKTGHRRDADRKGLHALLRMERLQALADIQKAGEAARREVRQHYPKQEWQGFLIERAGQGDTVALSCLQTLRGPARGAQPPRVYGAARKAPVFPPKTYRYRVHGNGDVSFSLTGGGRLRDTAQGIVILDKRPDAATVETALRLAALKYGPELHVQGSSVFRSQAQLFARRLQLTLVRPQSRPASESQPALPIQDRVLERYLEQRNALVGKVRGLSRHRVFGPADAGTVIYQGQRQLEEGRTVALFQDATQQDTLVMAVTDSQAIKLRRAGVDADVQIARNGNLVDIRARGRER